MTFIKICGITNLEDALVAVDAGADALGFNFYKESPRYIAPRAAREIIEQLPVLILKVGIFVDEESLHAIEVAGNDAGVSAFQLHGDESPSFCAMLAQEYYVIKAFPVGPGDNIPRVHDYEVEAIMLDTKHGHLRGGTGRVFDWSIAQRVNRFVPKLFLAGGLSPENVEEAILTVRPYAVDACSSLEDRPGRKNHERLRAFVERARNVKP